MLPIFQWDTVSDMMLIRILLNLRDLLVVFILMLFWYMIEGVYYQKDLSELVLIIL